MPDLRALLEGMRTDAHARPGTWIRHTLSRGLELHWRLVRETRADELVLRREDVQPSEDEVQTCLAHLPAGLVVAHRFDYLERRSIKLALTGRRCRCGAALEPNDLLFAADEPSCAACQLAAKVKPEEKLVAPCAGGCGRMAPYEPYHDPERVYCFACGVRAARDEAEARATVFRAE